MAYREGEPLSFGGEYYEIALASRYLCGGGGGVSILCGLKVLPSCSPGPSAHSQSLREVTNTKNVRPSLAKVS